MTVRDESARYYDLQDFPIDDVPFYEARVRPNDRVLELGCGTGRVLVPLARRCAFIHGVDASEAMLAICREKLVATGGSPPDPQSLGSPPTRAAPRGGSANPTRRDPRPSQSRTPVPREHALDRDRERLSWRLTCADITALDLGETFDLMIAPFRVLQNLETDAQLEGLMTTIERHLAPAGRAILNAFRPYKPAAEAVATWCEPGEILDFEKE
ncbi:MAG TPA: class I SAM-dependent methyltransferase, partial [Chthonomonadaceae bacterium]|nr:class I SAM-dependent methyltransferase [Chthonomonadaceae bacterium]